ncbi:hypothetical protein TNCV_623121 [Trichonephila clavipes]|nr:hypothetical protein TNCV_623121 [Trichonephila clavipes]
MRTKKDLPKGSPSLPFSLFLAKSAYIIDRDVIDFCGNFQKHPYGHQKFSPTWSLGRQSLLLRAAAETFSMFSAVLEVCDCPELLSSSTLSLPSLKRRCHSKVCVRDNVPHPYTCLKFRKSP